MIKLQTFIVYYIIGCNKITLSEVLNKDIDVFNSIVDLIENNNIMDMKKKILFID